MQDATTDLGSELWALVVADDGRWFEWRGTGRIDLSRRRSLRLMLLALARAREEQRDGALDLDRLFEAGWPGERIRRSAAHRRVYTAVGTLRDFGLRGVLVRRDDGYLLSRSVPLARPSSDV
jgi:hypothetical protein